MTARIIGYARVSTIAQDLQLQVDALAAAGCEPMFTDHASGAKSKRPGLDACVKELKAGDILVVWRLVSGLAPGSPRALDATPGWLGRAVAAEGRGLPIAPGWVHRHHHRDWRAHVPYVLEPSTVRATPDSGADQCWPDSCTCTRPPRWTPADYRRRSARPGYEAPAPGP